MASSTHAAPGYSGKPLSAKLGLRDGACAWVLSAPTDYRTWLGDVDVTLVEDGAAPSSQVDLIHVFATSENELHQFLEKIAPCLTAKPILWISWKKGTKSGSASLNREDVRRIVLSSTDFVDVKVAAISDVWSGLKFLRRRGT